MDTSTTTPLYGAWITPQGDLIPVPEECHFEVAVEILYPGNVHVSPAQLQTIYNDMYQNSYIRLVFLKSGGYKLEYRSNQKPTAAQKDYIKNAADLGIW